MKFVCHSCSAKYSISDDKIAGGTYSVRCKRCGETLVLRNGAIETRPLAHDLTPEEPELRGQRNENSLLFSVRDTSQISAMVAPSGAAAAGGSNRSSDASRTEGSGLLDIQRLAASYQAQDSAAEGNSAVPLQISDDYTPPPFVLPAAPAEPGLHRRLLLGLYTTAGSLVVASLVLALVVVGRGESQLPGQTAESIEPTAQTVAASATADDTSTPATVGDVSTSVPVTTTPEVTAPASDATAETTSAEETPVAATTTAEKPAAKKPVVAARSRSERTRSSRSTSKTTSKTSTTTDRNDTALSRLDGSKTASCLDEIACELADHPPACCARYKTSSPDRSDRPDPTRTANLPDRLDRAAIMKGITSVRPKVKACSSSDPAKGQVLVRIKIAGDGKVTSVTVKDTPSDGLGRCVAKAMNSARFAESKKGMSFNYPFVF